MSERVRRPRAPYTKADDLTVLGFVERRDAEKMAILMRRIVSDRRAAGDTRLYRIKVCYRSRTGTYDVVVKQREAGDE